jgi:dolichyl-phosphate-mannose-protein mannosyltransferase
MGPATRRTESAFVSRRLLRNPILVSLMLALACFFLYRAGIANPPQVFYDEAYYVPAARAMLTNQPNPDPQAPPLGKLLIAAGIDTLGDNALGWRMPSAICGALTISAVFAWTYVLLDDLGLALIAAALAFFSNFTFVMSRVAMMDASLVAFLMWSLVAYTAAHRPEMSAARRRMLMCCAGTLVGLAGACKWNAVDTLAVMLCVSFGLPWLAKRMKPGAQGSLAQYARALQQIGIPWLLLALLVCPIASYALTFWPLCHSLHLPFEMHRIVEMNRYIWRWHRTVLGNRAIISAWYTWPFKTVPQRGLSDLLGNPVVMWGGLVALIYCVWRLKKSFDLPEALAALLYMANLLQWAVTPMNGVAYYYYYPAAMILCVALAVSLRSAPERVFGVRISLVLLSGAGAVFLWYIPRMAHLESPWDCVLGCWS